MSNLSDQVLPRRAFLRGQFLNSLKTETVKQQGYQAIRPPWADTDSFIEKCTACHKCIESCETQIIKVGDAGYPEIDFSRGECTFCQQCVATCPEPVFISTEQVAWQHKIEIGSNCLLNQKVECRSCGDSCEQRAISFKPSLGGIAQLILNLDDCNGCGACLSICPTQAIKIAIEQNDKFTTK